MANTFKSRSSNITNTWTVMSTEDTTGGIVGTSFGALNDHIAKE